jgi:hypothetical protein
MTSNMSSGKLLLCVIVLTVLSVSGAFFSGSRELALIIGTVILCILFIARGIWGRANSGRLKLAVLTLGLAAVNVAPTGRLLLVQIFTWLLGSPQNSQNAFTNLVPFFEQILSPPDVFERIYSLVVPLYNLGFTALVLKYWHGPSESNDTTLRASDEAPPAPLTYPARRELLLEELQAKYEGMIRNSDWRRARITQWTLDRYLPLAVKVEEKEDGLIWKRPVQSNILRTLHRDRTTRSFLLLGEPGSGKSFTLRKLALDMLKDARSGGQIPIYVDLRDWLPKTAAAEVRIWTESDPPTFEELGTFIEDYLTSHSDPVVVAFVAECFRVMRTRGDFFFIFDSFDELPQLLGEGDDSWLISHLSDLIWRYMTLAPGSRGILASRLFRRPFSRYFRSPNTRCSRHLSESLTLMRTFAVRFSRCVGTSCLLREIPFCLLC